MDKFFDAHGAIELKSPPHYPAYNDAIRIRPARTQGTGRTTDLESMALEKALVESPSRRNANQTLPGRQNRC